MNIKPQKAFTVVSVEDELPQEGKKCFVIEYPTQPVMEGTVKGINYRSDISKSGLSRQQKERIAENNNFIHGSKVTHWLKEQELYCFTADELRNFLGEMCTDLQTGQPVDDYINKLFNH